MLDCLIIGAGIIGCTIARVLSRYQIDVAVAEATDDVAMGTSRANSAIVHAGYDCVPESLMARYNVAGNRLYAAWCDELDVPLKPCGSLVISRSAQEVRHLYHLYDQGRKNGVPGLELWDGDLVLGMEPKLHPAIYGALYAPTACMTSPYEMTIACAENAAMNGVRFHFGCPIERIEVNEAGFRVHSPNRVFQTRTIINAAGVFADEIAGMIGDASFSIHARRGEYLLLDQSIGCYTKHIIFQTPSPMGKGVVVAHTVDGNLYIGPSAQDTRDKLGTETTAEGLASIREAAARSLPNLPYASTIRTFAGLRAVADCNDFIVRASDVQPRMIHAAGICSPGLTSAPAIAEDMPALLSQAGLTMKQRHDYQPNRSRIPAFRHMTLDQRSAAIERNPAYGRIVCRCEQISEAEIVESIHRVPGATSVDGVKRRVRAGMGRCQGGFCSPRVMRILARELDRPLSDITLHGGQSKLLVGMLGEEQHESKKS